MMAVPGPAPLVLLIALAATSAAAEDRSPTPMERGESQRVAEVIDGDTLVLEDGTEVRLVAT